MNNYDDFALPTLENIEKLARAYKEMEKNENNKVKTHKSTSINDVTLQTIYNKINSAISILDKAKSYNTQSNKYYIICEKAYRLKHNFEIIFYDNKLNTLYQKIVFTENNLDADLIYIWLEVIREMLFLSDNEQIKNLIYEIISICMEIIKY